MRSIQALPIGNNPYVLFRIDEMMPNPRQPTAERLPTTGAIIEPRDDGVHLEVPPRSFLRGSSGLGFFSVFWLVFTLVLSIVMIPGGGSSMILILLPFWLVGLGMLVGAVAMSRRHLVADVIRTGDDDAVLMIFRKGLFSSRQHELTRTQVASIHIRPTNVQINNRPLLALEVQAHDGKTIRLLSSTQQQDLLPVRDALGNALGL